jgi:RiboL-PSP-HEPN
MLNALVLFNKNVDIARQAGGLYEYLTTTVISPLSFDDLLRSQVVYSVSAFDKLLHDLVRIGMVETFLGVRAATPKYLAESISIGTHMSLNSVSLPPKEIIFENAIIEKLKILSFQKPDKVADGLSYIWNESHKWQKIAGKIGMSENYAINTLKLIATRRNAIVHEADIDPITNTKFSITQVECENITNFLHRCGNEITSLVKL